VIYGRGGLTPLEIFIKKVFFFREATKIRVFTQSSLGAVEKPLIAKITHLTQDEGWPAIRARFPY
jgi:hypothetical protein